MTHNDVYTLIYVIFNQQVHFCLNYLMCNSDMNMILKALYVVNRGSF